MRGFVRLICVGFQDLRYPSAQPTQLFLQFLVPRMVRFCGHVARQFIQIIPKQCPFPRPVSRIGRIIATSSSAVFIITMSALPRNDMTAHAILSNDRIRVDRLMSISGSGR